MSPDGTGPFPRRNSYYPSDREITIREDAPEGLRATVLQLGEQAGLGAGEFEEIVRRTLQRLSSADWSPLNLLERLGGIIEMEQRVARWTTH